MVRTNRVEVKLIGADAEHQIATVAVHDEFHTRLFFEMLKELARASRGGIISLEWFDVHGISRDKYPREGYPDDATH